MLDLDHPQGFHDAFGREASDAVLRELSMFLQENSRYGGDGFMLILPEASLDSTGQPAEQLREGIKHLRVQWRQYLWE